MVTMPDMTRLHEARARAAATSARVDALIEEVRNRPIPESLWEAPARPQPEPSHPVVQRTAPAAGSARSAAGVTKATLDRRFDAFEQAVGEVMRMQREAWERRVCEAERCISVLEARIAEMEGTR